MGEKNNGELLIKRNKDYLKNFYGENISNISVLVGKNGSGKTTILDILGMDREDRLKNSIKKKSVKDEYFLLYYLYASTILKKELGEDERALLNEFLNIRNWTFHNPQSMLVAEDEVALRRIPKQYKEYVKIVPQVNPVIIIDIVGYTVEKLASFIFHIERRIQQFETILSCMKNDYQELYDSLEIRPMIISSGGDMFKVQYCRQKIVAGIDDFGSDIAQISMAIQKSKYDGSDDKFYEWVIRRNNKKAK